MKKLLIATLIVFLVAGVYLWKQIQSERSDFVGITSVNGRLELERLDIATLYAGRIEEMYVKEGQNVEKNEPLVRLSSTQSQSQVEATEAQIVAAQAQVESAKAQKLRAEEAVSRANAEMNAQQQQVAVAKLELDNARKLRRDNLISASELERRQANYKAAQSAVEAAKAAKTEAQVAVNQAQATISQAQANVNQAQAQSKQASSQNDDMLIKAPIAGRVEYKIADVGSVVGAGSKVISLLDPKDVYLNVFLPAHQSNSLKIGDEARIKIDGMDNVFPAHISYVASSAQFTPKSVETAEERTKLMFKVKLQVPEDVALNYAGLFKGGMTAIGYVKYDNTVDWPESLSVKLP
ncbi:HlyD family efflux transporter periplasmic adaptor subunit [Mannheimia sp. AT1]|uniref:HlyD family efflux transporter periplasmic adaptor subunit n=1 Tax=Mannheimia cairinae TaxID=3025936 RepID=A0ABT5MQA1_9PAST|nr:HlyD family efflux transporter periplasmic adaptor subunit [Mannheimia cairinae]MDD0823671.1 HlyD family efflux transporter periplasmic adaptor subunit [Mannheimia cairinae]MDD0825397.1 HlyD family efflux transporter periplasmic adaptor subunit [Mannheimia cairinae]